MEEVFTTANQPINVVSTKAINRHTVFYMSSISATRGTMEKEYLFKIVSPPHKAARQALHSLQKEESSVADP
jgi:hypothetical protein